MKTKIIEARNAAVENWGKFAVGQFTDEWSRRSVIPGAESLTSLIWRLGWRSDNIWVLDLQTGEGAFFKPGGLASADLDKHAIWVCPLYEPFLAWLYQQDLSDLDHLPDLVDLDAPFEMSGYRRPGPPLAEAQADVRALATAINTQGCNCGARAESPNTHPHVLGCETGKALARPGVRRMMEVGP